MTPSHVETDAETQEALPPARSRRWRNIVVAAIVGMMLVSSLWLTDDAWPFAPFRMFAYANKLDGVAYSVGFLGATADGEEVRLDALDFGLRRAEIEGQLPRVLDEPGMLADLAETYNQAHSSGDELVRLEMLETGRKVENGRPTDRHVEVLQVWEAP